MVHYGLNKIKLAFGAQYKIVILTLLTQAYLLSGLGLGLENAGLEARTHPCLVSKPCELGVLVLINSLCPWGN